MTKARTHVAKAELVTQGDFLANQHVTRPKMDTLLAYTFSEKQITSFASHFRLRAFGTNYMQMGKSLSNQLMEFKEGIFGGTKRRFEQKLFTKNRQFLFHRLFQGLYHHFHYYATFLFKTPLSTLQYASVNHTLYGKCVMLPQLN